MGIGIIPTRVGTSLTSIVSGISDQDHPHACGDKGHCLQRAKLRIGSSPRVWGQVAVEAEWRRKYRIIPTRVGTRLSVVILAHSHKDHPHACGDKDKIIKFCFVKIGSSPRVWGQGFSKLCCGAKARIIPTRVGTRLSMFFTRCGTKDHPHACGDKISSSIL